MKKIMRFLFLLIGLLMATVVKAYKIEEINHSHGSITEIKYGTTDVTVGVVSGTDIPSGQTVTMTVTPDPGYYLSSLVYEEVTPLDIALAPRRAPDIKPIHNITIPTNNSTYIQAHYGGTYTFTMPENDVIITATFENLTDFDNNANITIELNDGGTGYTSRIYKGGAYDVLVKNTVLSSEQQILTVGKDYIITDVSYNNTSMGNGYPITLVGSYTIAIQGIGIYYKNKSSALLTITQKELTITAKNQTITYGNSITVAPNQVDVTGLASTYGDALTSIDLTPSTTDVTTTGTITPSNAIIINGSSDVTANYTIPEVNYHTGVLTINKRDIGSTQSESAVLSLSGDGFNTEGKYFNYTGSEPNRTIDVTYNNNPLTLNADYTVVTTGEYQGESPDLSKPDIYTVTINFGGNYKGSLTTIYQIRQKITWNNNNRWRTYCEQDVNFRVPAKFVGYKVKGIDPTDNTRVEVEEVEDIIKGQPMMLYRKDGTGTSDSDYGEILPKSTATWTSGSCFKYNGSNTSIEDLAGSGNDVWILVNDEFVRTKTGTLPAGKCYLLLLQNSFSAGARLLINTDITWIEAVKSNAVDIDKKGVWYTLDGRQTQGFPLQKGIYITNGKKVFIK